MASRYPFAVSKEMLHARAGDVVDFAMGARRLELPEELQQWLNDNAGLAVRPAAPSAVADFKDAAAELIKTE